MKFFRDYFFALLKEYKLLNRSFRSEKLLLIKVVKCEIDSGSNK